MKLQLLLIVLTAGLTCLTQAGEAQPSGVIHIDHVKVAAGGTLLQTNNFKVMILHRERPGEVEMHERDTDIFHVLKGSATFVTGGKAVELAKTAPGELRGKEIVGGEEHHLTQGDVIVIPHGVPHWFKGVDGPFDYYVVKVSN